MLTTLVFFSHCLTNALHAPPSCLLGMGSSTFKEKASRIPSLQLPSPSSPVGTEPASCSRCPHQRTTHMFTQLLVPEDVGWWVQPGSACAHLRLGQGSCDRGMRVGHTLCAQRKTECPYTREGQGAGAVGIRLPFS